MATKPTKPKYEDGGSDISPNNMEIDKLPDDILIQIIKLIPILEWPHLELGK
jgi:hypothetical protein